jgi:hypothetical protein
VASDSKDVTLCNNDIFAFLPSRPDIQIALQM